MVLASGISLGAAQTAQNVSGIFSTNTTWTKANGPYTLTGPVSVSPGVTLTVEPGVTVNLGNYYLQVNGTLVAKGTNTNNVHFIGGSQAPNFAITFSETGSNYNEQTGTGSIIENAIIEGATTGIDIHKVSPKIDNNTITADFAVEVWDGSQVISNNVINGGVGTHNATPTITGNTITGTVYGYGITSGQNTGNTIISNNKIFAPILAQDTGIYCGNTVISGNTIYGFQTGIQISLGTTTVQKNLVVGNVDGIRIGDGNYDFYYANIYSQHFSPFIVTIQNNMITQNSQGIAIRNEYTNIGNSSVFSVSISNNNIESNGNYNFYLKSKTSFNAPNNWWGTTDTHAVNQTIYDFKDDFNLGKVTFTPFLSAPDPQAPSANLQVPTPAPTPTTSSSANPTSTTQPTATPMSSPSSTTGTGTQTILGLDLFQTLIVTLLAAIAVLLMVLIAVMYQRKTR
jgi:hypothetical protein